MDSTVQWVGGPDSIKRRNWAPAFLSLCFLTVKATWPSVSGSCCRTSAAMLSLPKITFIHDTASSGYFVTATSKVTQRMLLKDWFYAHRPLRPCLHLHPQSPYFHVWVTRYGPSFLSVETSLLPPTSGHLWSQRKDSDLVLDAYKDSGIGLSIFGVVTFKQTSQWGGRVTVSYSFTIRSLGDCKVPPLVTLGHKDRWKFWGLSAGQLQ